MSAVSRPEPLDETLPQGRPMVVWVLVPHIETTDESLAWYCDFAQSRAEFRKAFRELGLSWRWQRVTLANHAAVIARIARRQSEQEVVVFNLCDGDEANGAPGLSVIHALEHHGLRYTGSDARFYDGTTSKIGMKRDFDCAGVPTATWEVVAPDVKGRRGIFERLGSPIIIKPAVSAGSMGVTIKSVVATEKELNEQMERLEAGYHGWDLTSAGVLAERFVSGREFTTFIVGSHDAPSRKMIYPPVERCFNAALPELERFLSFDRLWGLYEAEEPVGGDKDEDLWKYRPVSRSEAKKIREVSWAAFAAARGRGYGRVDLRQDSKTGELAVLEVNAQCGLSEDENFTSIGAILRFAGKPYSHAVDAIIAASASRGRRGNVRIQAAVA